MTEQWSTKGIPHKGWILSDVIDLGKPLESCMMCGKERIRFVHILKHEDIDEEYRVGCVCAENMTNDYITHKEKELQLKNYAKRLSSWNRRVWKETGRGNYYITIKKKQIFLFLDKKTCKWKVKIGTISGNKYFDDIESAKKAAFKGVEYLKSKIK